MNRLGRALYIFVLRKAKNSFKCLTRYTSSQPMGFYAPAQLIQEARRHGVCVLPVDETEGYDCTLQVALLRSRLNKRGITTAEALWRYTTHTKAKTAGIVIGRTEGTPRHRLWSHVRNLIGRNRHYQCCGLAQAYRTVPTRAAPS